FSVECSHKHYSFIHKLKHLAKIPLPGRISPNRAERCASMKKRVLPYTRFSGYLSKTHPCNLR
ncbi:MAG TPA: hypothetical protein VNF48_01650, partial [Gammaproteobacteria bacterium]|nr:hypothetical protein [Gammaproteobacteria bacterium]